MRQFFLNREVTIESSEGSADSRGEGKYLSMDRHSLTTKQLPIIPAHEGILKNMVVIMTEFFPYFVLLKPLILFTLVFSEAPLLAASYKECLMRTLEKGSDTLALGRNQDLLPG